MKIFYRCLAKEGVGGGGAGGLPKQHNIWDLRPV